MNRILRHENFRAGDKFIPINAIVFMIEYVTDTERYLSVWYWMDEP